MPQKQSVLEAPGNPFVGRRFRLMPPPTLFINHGLLRAGILSSTLDGEKDRLVFTTRTPIWIPLFAVILLATGFLNLTEILNVAFICLTAAVILLLYPALIISFVHRSRIERFERIGDGALELM